MYDCRSAIPSIVNLNSRGTVVLQRHVHGTGMPEHAPSNRVPCRSACELSDSAQTALDVSIGATVLFEVQCVQAALVNPA